MGARQHWQQGCPSANLVWLAFWADRGWFFDSGIMTGLPLEGRMPTVDDFDGPIAVQA